MTRAPNLARKHGAWYYVERLAARDANGNGKRRWHRLCNASASNAAVMAAYKACLARLHTAAITPREGDLPTELARYLAIRRTQVSPREANELERIGREIARCLAEFRVGDVRAADIDEYLAAYADRRRTAQRHRHLLSGFFRWAIRADLRRDNPVDSATRVKRPVPRTGAMTSAIFWRLHAALPPAGQIFLELAYLTRQRAHDIRIMTWAQVRDGKLVIQPSKTARSTGASVEIDIGADIRAALDRAQSTAKVRALRGSETPIIQTAGGTAYTRWGLHSMWQRACRRAGIEGVTTLDIRPFALAEMERAGVPLATIQRAAAHASVITTEGKLRQHRGPAKVDATTLPPRAAVDTGRQR